MLSENLVTLRKLHLLSQETVAEEVGVSRQALAKWESGETIPDIEKCMKLANLYEVSLDDLVSHSCENSMGLPVPPKGKHLFGMVTVGEKGQMVIPKEARDVFGIKSGDKLMILGDEAQGLAILPADKVLPIIRNMKKMLDIKD